MSDYLQRVYLMAYYVAIDLIAWETNAYLCQSIFSTPGENMIHIRLRYQT